MAQNSILGICIYSEDKRRVRDLILYLLSND